MMLDHLGHHPQLFGLRIETYILPHYLSHEKKYGDLAHDENFLHLWNDMRAEYAFRRANRNRPVDLPFDWASIPRSAAAVFDRILHEFASSEGKNRWCEKTPMYAVHIDRLQNSFPSALFIHMIRDGRDCAASNHRRWGRHPNSTMYRWKQVVTEARRQGSMIPGRYIEVHYEDLTDDPDVHMRRVCEFVGVEFDERVLLANKVRKGMAGHQSQEIVNVRDRNAGYFDERRLRQFDRIAGQTLAEFGYPSGCPECDADASLLVRSWWFVHDSCLVLFRQVRNKIFVQKNMTWRLWLLRLRGIIRHTRSSSVRSRTDRQD